VAIGTLNQKLRPVRMAFLVDPTDEKTVQTAINKIPQHSNMFQILGLSRKNCCHYLMVFNYLKVTRGAFACILFAF